MYIFYMIWWTHLSTVLSYPDGYLIMGPLLSMITRFLVSQNMKSAKTTKVQKHVFTFCAFYRDSQSGHESSVFRIRIVSIHDPKGDDVI